MIREVSRFAITNTWSKYAPSINEVSSLFSELQGYSCYSAAYRLLGVLHKIRSKCRGAKILETVFVRPITLAYLY